MSESLRCAGDDADRLLQSRRREIRLFRPKLKNRKLVKAAGEVEMSRGRIIALFAGWYYQRRFAYLKVAHVIPRKMFPSWKLQSVGQEVTKHIIGISPAPMERCALSVTVPAGRRRRPISAALSSAGRPRRPTDDDFADALASAAPPKRHQRLAV